MLDPKPELAKTTAYFNLDNGTGKIRGIWMQSNDGGQADLRSLDAAAEGSGRGDPRAAIRRVRPITRAFDALGVPAFQFVQERYEYNSRTHHSNMDFYDRVQADDMKQIATVAAVFVWQAANRDAAAAEKSPDALASDRRLQNRLLRRVA